MPGRFVFFAASTHLSVGTITIFPGAGHSVPVLLESSRVSALLPGAARSFSVLPGLYLPFILPCLYLLFVLYLLLVLPMIPVWRIRLYTFPVSALKDFFYFLLRDIIGSSLSCLADSGTAAGAGSPLSGMLLPGPLLTILCRPVPGIIP